MKKTLFLSIIFSFVLIIAIWIYWNNASVGKTSQVSTLRNLVPINYDECVKSPGSSYNQVSCLVNYDSSSDLIDVCLSLGGCNPAWADGLPGCKVWYFNPEFKYPLIVKVDSI